jgi:hypothetical protein
MGSIWPITVTKLGLSGPCIRALLWAAAACPIAPPRRSGSPPSLCNRMSGGLSRSTATSWGRREGWQPRARESGGWGGFRTHLPISNVTLREGCLWRCVHETCGTGWLAATPCLTNRNGSPSPSPPSLRDIGRVPELPTSRDKSRFCCPRIMGPWIEALLVL